MSAWEDTRSSVRLMSCTQDKTYDRSMLRTSPSPYRPQDETAIKVLFPVPEAAAILRTTDRSVRRHVQAELLEAVTVIVAVNDDGDLLVTADALPEGFRELCTRTCIPAEQVTKFLATQGAR